jgi:predicted RNase H-like nuclease
MRFSGETPALRSTIALSSLIGWMGGGVQPANRSRTMFFGEAAPIWRFLENLAAIGDPEMARVADQGVYLLEVFPALALAAFDPAFFGRLKGPRYNPDRRKVFNRRLDRDN